MHDLLAALAEAGIRSDASTVTRAAYSSDASLHRVVPLVVARPRSGDELAHLVELARAWHTPLTMRGAGTSIAGNAVGSGIVADTSDLNAIVEFDPEAGTAWVEPGVVHAQLQALVGEAGWRFGPDPSTHSRCTIGGMIGNNACGSRALGYGRTSDNIAAAEVIWGNGQRGDAQTTGSALADLVAADLGHVRTHFGRFSRQVSGYALEQLLPEHGARVDRFLAGSEGTLAVVTSARVQLVRNPEATALVLLGYADMATAADAVPDLLDQPPGQQPVAIEGMDARLVDLVRARRAVPALPAGNGWLMVEVVGETPAAAHAAAQAVAVSSGRDALGVRIVTDPAEQAALWRIREDGAGLGARSLSRPAYSGWEDSAVPPARLGTWLREFEELLTAHGLATVPYGHFGEGCVHARIDFDFSDGPARYREFVTAAAHAVVALGGSLSGEHGDGRARSELLSVMYDDRSLALFGAIKQWADPDNVLNPGVLVDPVALDADLRPARTPRYGRDLAFLSEGVHRCTGVGRCVAPTSGGVMCPSWQATRDEKDSTRGRARVLQEALDGELVDGLADPAVAEALDLCVACKGCASDCPTGVDMAAYKSEVLAATYADTRRPRSHIVLGRLPQWLDRAGVFARPLAAAANGPLGRPAKWAAGVDVRRRVPLPARWRDRLRARDGGDAPEVWLWADTFTDGFAPDGARDALTVLESAGIRVGVIEAGACCALTWVTTGQLDAARQRLTATVATLQKYAGTGMIVGLEPSCLATLRDDAPRLLGTDGAREVAAATRTLAEVLTELGPERGWTPPDLSGVRIVAQPHCHHASILGWDADAALLRSAGAELTVVGGCCGLAGNFGMERGHYDVSVAMANTSLLPAVHAAGPQAVVLADGLSCRHQLDDLAGVSAVSLATLLARGVVPTPIPG